MCDKVKFCLQRHLYVPCAGIYIFPMSLSPLLEILAACLQVPSLLGPFKLQEGQQRQWCRLGLASQQEGAAYLPVQSPLPPLPASGEHSKSPAKRLSLPCVAPRALTVLQP